MTEPEPQSTALITTGSGGLIRRMDRRLELVDRVLAKLQAERDADAGREFEIAADATQEFSRIPAGTFMMGDSLDGDERAPPHEVYLSGFSMARHPVTKALWDEVCAWGLANGYPDLPEGKGKAADHPVVRVSWYDAVKWCNARSEKEGLTPCYYTDTAQTVIYRTGENDIDTAMVKWSANGYRLPTEAEWEKSARGGVSGKRYPWGTDTISHSQANYPASGTDYGNLSGNAGFHPTYKTGGPPYTSPVGSFAANGYGLYDMAGNVQEWCWDWYSGSTYTEGATDPRGAATDSDRVIRGGGWDSVALFARCALRAYFNPAVAYDAIGFRVARGQP